MQFEMMISASMRRLVTQAISNEQTLSNGLFVVKIVIHVLNVDLHKGEVCSARPRFAKDAGEDG